MKQSVFLRLALTAALAFGAGCYNYAPPRSLAQVGAYEAPPGLEDPDAIAVVDKTPGSGKKSDASNAFTFVDGRGHELGVDELLERYRRVVGDDAVADAFGKNHLALSLGLAALSAGLIVLTTLGIEACARDTCSTKQKEGLVLAGGVTALVTGGTLFEMLEDDRTLAPLTRAQAEELVARYDAALLRRGRTAPREAQVRGGPELRATGLSLAF